MKFVNRPIESVTFTQLAANAIGRRAAPATVTRIAAAMRHHYKRGLAEAWNTRTEVAFGVSLETALRLVQERDAPLTLLPRRVARVTNPYSDVTVGEVTRG